MAKRKLGLIVLLFCMCLCLLPCTAHADQSPWDSKTCTLTIIYDYNDKSFADVNVKLYHIADLSEDYEFTLTSQFAASGLELNGIQSQHEWNVISSSLQAYIVANKVPASYEEITDENGQVHFSPLSPGLYMASAVDIVEEDYSYSFKATLFSITEDLTASPKVEAVPNIGGDEVIEYKIIKLWNGDSGKNTRPKSIVVEIFRDEESYKTVSLSGDNNWAYSWSAKNDGSKWTVVEKNVPSGYVATVLQRDEIFVLTNTLKIDDPNKPIPTGDDSNIMLYIVLMFASGTVLIFLGTRRMRASK